MTRPALSVAVTLRVTAPPAAVRLAGVTFGLLSWGFWVSAAAATLKDTGAVAAA